MPTDIAGMTNALSMVRDPLIQLVMASDGVTEAELVGLMMELQYKIAVADGDQHRRPRAVSHLQ
jgi:hypothetical protein